MLCDGVIHGFGQDRADFRSVENLQWIVLDCDSATGARGLSTLAFVEQTVYGGLKMDDKNWGSRGLAPLGCLPLRGKEEVPS
jgi:hypothetical protein